ncbi:hypothetical protein [Phenylobacterium sp.]|uniref:hypothetical protein n=1 Tax=Phenylobacterium sp. TaxID=1871053 RepID=UPI002735FA59|nr:hypothetical protein [Phenylobacterium sp.]MDP3852647.1 hypothetical protein [Phenylobacterium sp.]
MRRPTWCRCSTRLCAPTLRPDRVPAFAPHLKVFQRDFYDLEDATADGPVRRVIHEMVDFLQDWTEGAPGARLLCHCHMGASRSTAAAFIALCIRRGKGMEAEAFETFLRVVNKPWPNLRMVTLGDDILQRQGAMVAALETYRATYPRRILAYRRLNARRGIYQ